MGARRAVPAGSNSRCGNPCAWPCAFGTSAGPCRSPAIKVYSVRRESVPAFSCVLDGNAVMYLCKVFKCSRDATTALTIGGTCEGRAAELCRSQNAAPRSQACDDLAQHQQPADSSRGCKPAQQELPVMQRQLQQQQQTQQTQNQRRHMLTALAVVSMVLPGLQIARPPAAHAVEEIKLYEDQEDKFAIDVPAKWTRAVPQASTDRFRCAPQSTSRWHCNRRASEVHMRGAGGKRRTASGACSKDHQQCLVNLTLCLASIITNHNQKLHRVCHLAAVAVQYTWVLPANTVWTCQNLVADESVALGLSCVASTNRHT